MFYLCILILGFVIVYLWRDICYQFKFISFWVISYIIAVLFIPTTFRRPGDVRNSVVPCQVIAILCRWIGVKYEMRGSEYVKNDEGAMLATNHQHMVDLLGLMNYSTTVKKFTMIMKQSLMFHPAGIASLLFGVVFLDRTGGDQSYKKVNKWAFDAKKDKIKVWIHPEGTRNFEAFKSQCLLPFKKGTFHAAISAQIPIIPLVFSPYYFINNDRKFFGKGRVIMEVLPPVPTKGLTKDDTTALLQRVRAIMTEKYRHLCKEIYASLPPSDPVFQYIQDIK